MIRTSYFSRTSAQIIAGWAKTELEKKNLQTLHEISIYNGYSTGVFSHMELRAAEPIIRGIMERKDRRSDLDIPDEWEIAMLRELNVAIKCDEEHYTPAVRILLAISRYLRQKIYGDGIEIWKEVRTSP